MDHRLNRAATISLFMTWESTMPWRLASTMSISRPRSIFSCLSSFLNQERILLLACWVLTMDSQSRLGPATLVEVMISTISPIWSSRSRGTILPLTLAPIQRLPIWLWMR